MFLHRLHMLLGQELGCLALSDNFHDFKGHGRIEAVVDEVEHDAVSCTDNLADVAGSAPDEILRVAQPNIGAVGKSGDLQQVRKILWLTVEQHLTDKGGAHLRNGQGTRLTFDLLCGDP